MAGRSAAKRFAAALSAVMPAIERVTKRLGPPTEFEALTAAAFQELAEAGVDLALVEVGLGGRLDATNVLDPGVAAITNVQHDHERLLGPTLAAIGAEKAAIIKPGNLAVTGAQGRGLRTHPRPLRGDPGGAAARGPRTAVSTPLLREAGWDGIVVDARRPGAARSRVCGRAAGKPPGRERRGGPGRFSTPSSKTPSGAEIGWASTTTAIRRGFAAARWPGRLELLTGDRRRLRVLLDGAHNPAGARAAGSQPRRAGHAPLPDGLRSDARQAGRGGAAGPGTARSASRSSPASRTPAPSPRGAAGALATHRRRRTDGAEPRGALRLAADLRRSAEQPVVVAGSLYLVGAVRGMLRGEEDERDGAAWGERT